jgi:hypothetical protein
VSKVLRGSQGIVCGNASGAVREKCRNCSSWATRWKQCGPEFAACPFNKHHPVKLSCLKKIRAYCLDCCLGNWSEVKQCPSKDTCSLYPYRDGHDPARAGKVNPAAAEALKRYRDSRQKPV